MFHVRLRRTGHLLVSGEVFCRSPLEQWMGSGVQAACELSLPVSLCNFVCSPSSHPGPSFSPKAERGVVKNVRKLRVRRTWRRPRLCHFPAEPSWPDHLPSLSPRFLFPGKERSRAPASELCGVRSRALSMVPSTWPTRVPACSWWWALGGPSDK